MQQVTQELPYSFDTGKPTGLKAKVDALKLKKTISMALSCPFSGGKVTCYIAPHEEFDV